MAHVMADGGSEALVPCSREDEQNDVSQGRHQLSRVPFSDPAGILAERDVATRMQAILDTPMAAIEPQEPGRPGLRTRETGDPVSDLDFHLGTDASLTLDPEHLQTVHPITREVLRHPGRRGQGPLLPTAVPFIDLGEAVETLSTKFSLEGGKGPRWARQKPL